MSYLLKKKHRRFISEKSWRKLTDSLGTPLALLIKISRKDKGRTEDRIRLNEQVYESINYVD